MSCADDRRHDIACAVPRLLHGHPRRHDRQSGAADPRRRAARRGRGTPVGRRRLHAHVRRVPAAGRCAGRPRRGAADVPRRPGAVRRRVAGVRARTVDRRGRRRARRPGFRRRARRAVIAGVAARQLRRPRAACPGGRGVGRHGRDRRGHRLDPGRRPDERRRLARRVPRQCPDRPGGDRADRAPRARRAPPGSAARARRARPVAEPGRAGVVELRPDRSRIRRVDRPAGARGTGHGRRRHVRIRRRRAARERTDVAAGAVRGARVLGRQCDRRADQPRALRTVVRHQPVLPEPARLFAGAGRVGDPARGGPAQHQLDPVVADDRAPRPAPGDAHRAGDRRSRPRRVGGDRRPGLLRAAGPPAGAAGVRHGVRDAGRHDRGRRVGSRRAGRDRLGRRQHGPPDRQRDRHRPVGQPRRVGQRARGRAGDRRGGVRARPGRAGRPRSCAASGHVGVRLWRSLRARTTSGTFEGDAQWESSTARRRS